MVLGLAIQLDAVPAAQLLARILSLAVEVTPQSRIAAANALSVALGNQATEGLITLALALAQDDHHEVRAAAGAAIAGCRLEPASALADLVHARLVELLSHPGTAAPRAILDTLIATKPGVTLDPGVRGLVENLKATSPSVAIRWRAARVMSRDVV